MIPVDQGEELFFREGYEENDAFLALLASVLTGSARSNHPNTPAAVAIFAIRSDSYERLQSESHLAFARQVAFNLSPIQRGDFKDIISGPAERATAAGWKIHIEPALVERLLQDAQGPDALPLLAFTLERLHADYGVSGKVSEANYEAMGGVRGSVEAAIERAFAEPGRQPVIPRDRGERERLLRKGFIPWLACVDPDTEEPRRRVASWEEIPGEVHGVLERLIEARLLVRDRRGGEHGAHVSVVVEVAHEALLRQWTALTSWLDEDFEALKAIEAIRRATGEWIKNGRDSGWLVHAGQRLQRAETLVYRPDFRQILGDAGQDYLVSCRTREEEARLDREAQLARIAAEQVRTARAQRRSRVLLSAVGIILAAFAASIVAQSRVVGRQRSQVLVVAADEALNNHAYARALRFAVRAARATWLSPAARDAEAQLVRTAHLSPEIARLPIDLLGDPRFIDGGRRFVTVTNGTVRLFDALTGTEIRRYVHQGYARVVTFSPDEQRVVIGGEDGNARILDAKTATKEIARFRHDGLVRAAFSHDGRRIVTLGSGCAKISDAQSGVTIAEATPEGDCKRHIWWAGFSPDEHQLVTASLDGLAVFDSVTGKETFHIRRSDVQYADFSPDGNRIASSGSNGTVVVDAQTGKQIGSFTGGRKAQFSPDGQRLLVISDNTATILDARTGEAITNITHDTSLLSATFSGDGNHLFTASHLTGQITDTRSGRKITSVTYGDFASGEIAFLAAFSPDGERIIISDERNTVRVISTWGVETARLAHNAVLRGASFSYDDHRVVTVSDNVARILEIRTGKEIARVVHEDAVRSAIFNSDGQHILTVSGRNARVSDAWTGTEISRISHDGLVTSAVFSVDGQRVLTASDDHTARVSDARTGRTITRISHDGTITSAVFSRDGQRVLTASDDRTARVSNAQTGSEITHVTDDRSITSAIFSPDGQHLVTVSSVAARVVDARTGSEIARITDSERIFSAAFSPDGRRVVTSAYNTAKVSDTQTGKEILRLTLPSGSIFSANFSRDGRRLLATSGSNAAQVFDAETGREVAQFTHDDGVFAAEFSHAGEHLLTASWDNTARVWDVSWLTRYGRELIETVCQKKLVGARRLSTEDTALAPVLAGSENDDICTEPSLRRLFSVFSRGTSQ